jgi:hypothetical protein
MKLKDAEKHAQNCALIVQTGCHTEFCGVFFLTICVITVGYSIIYIFVSIGIEILL